MVGLPKAENWAAVENIDAVPSPALLIFQERVEQNIRKMVSVAGSPERLRPHVKTHKMSAIIKLKQQHGISRFKCATLAEAEMVAKCGGKDILLAMQPVGPHIGLFFKLQQHYLHSRFSALADSPDVASSFSKMAVSMNQTATLWLDINNGMNRTGILPEFALQLYSDIRKMPCIQVSGLHVYDGHIHNSDFEERKVAVDKDYIPVIQLVDKIIKAGMPAPAIVAGGTPTFPFHAMRKGVETSPGTTVLWDAGYKAQFPDMDFLEAAILLMRVVSKPDRNLLCLDLGHKAIAAEMQPPRLRIIGLEGFRFISQSEEHLVIETPQAGKFKTGDSFIGIPWHICPTVPRYSSAFVVKDGKIAGEWKVDARDRNLQL